MAHYTDYNSFTEAFVAFGQLARFEGFNNGIDCTKDSISQAIQNIWLDKDLFRYGMMTLYCTNEEHIPIFEALFKKFWLPKGTRIRDKRQIKNRKTLSTLRPSIAVMIGTGSDQQKETGENVKTTSGANSIETLKKTDFSLLSHQQSDFLDELSKKFVREMSLRIKRRRLKSKKGTIDLARSIRNNLQKGGHMSLLIKEYPKKEKYRLLVLLDASGSMDKYSFYLLKFLWALRSHFRQMEIFAFSTTLMRITDYVSDNNMATALSLVSQNVKLWSSGTKIGDCLSDFNDNYSKRYLNGKTVTIVLSDGLDTGPPEILDAAMRKIKLKSKKMIWLNPLKGMAGYEPIQMGMKAALPSINHFESAHNFDSLLKLENLLIHA